MLVGLQLPGRDRWDTEDSVAELAQLAASAGARVVHTSLSHRKEADSATYIGSGKMEEIRQICRVQKANLVLFDDELTPGQSRNLQNGLGVKVLDRTELILDIFAQRARTREGQLQIEMAQLNYLLPRLAGAWTHLSRQEGGIGTRGPGEKQLEIDRRRVREKITRLENELDRVRRQRATQRKRRHKSEIPIVAIVGYTNAGKSTLMNALTKADVLVQDKLFATLDPTTRKVILPNHREFFLSDTVGFIRKLPHTLVDAFKATLEEVADADMLLHVIDASHPNMSEQAQAVGEVLKEIGAEERPTLCVLNKIDLVNGEIVPKAFGIPAPRNAAGSRGMPGNAGASVAALSRNAEHGVAISATEGTGIPDLLKAIEEMFNAYLVPVDLVIPQMQARAMAQVLSHGHVLATRYAGNNVHFRVELPAKMLHEFAAFVVKDKAASGTRS